MTPLQCAADARNQLFFWSQSDDPANGALAEASLANDVSGTGPPSSPSGAAPGVLNGIHPTYVHEKVMCGRAVSTPSNTDAAAAAHEPSGMGRASLQQASLQLLGLLAAQYALCG